MLGVDNCLLLCLGLGLWGGLYCGDFKVFVLFGFMEINFDSFGMG